MTDLQPVNGAHCPLHWFTDLFLSEPHHLVSSAFQGDIYSGANTWQQTAPSSSFDATWRSNRVHLGLTFCTFTSVISGKHTVPQRGRAHDVIKQGREELIKLRFLYRDNWVSWWSRRTLMLANGNVSQRHLTQVGFWQTDEIFPTFTLQVVLKQNIPLMCLLGHNISILDYRNFLFLQCSWSRPHPKNVFLWFPPVEPSHSFWNISSGWMKFNVDFIRVGWHFQTGSFESCRSGWMFLLFMLWWSCEMWREVTKRVEITQFRNCSQTTTDLVKNKGRHLWLTHLNTGFIQVSFCHLSLCMWVICVNQTKSETPLYGAQLLY